MVWKIPGSIFLLALSLFSQANRLVVAQQVDDSAVERLAKATLFSFGGVGFVGLRSRPERDYEEIMSRPSRGELLERVFEIGTSEAKCYALVGIYNLDHARFHTLAAPVRSSGSEVRTAHGCIIGRATLGAVIQHIEAGDYAHYV